MFSTEPRSTRYARNRHAGAARERGLKSFIFLDTFSPTGQSRKKGEIKMGHRNDRETRDTMPSETTAAAAAAEQLG